MDNADRPTRRPLLGSGLALSLALTLAAPGPLSAQEAAASGPWAPLKVKDINAMEWDDRWRMGNQGTSQGKLLYSNEQGAFMLYVYFAPGWDAINVDPHYHHGHEWVYILEGDFPLYEFVSPLQKTGTLVSMRAGTWMSRPAYSIHGNRPEVMARQKVPPGSVQLVFFEGGRTISLNPKRSMYSDEWKKVEQFTHAHFQHTASTDVMEWEESAELPGTSVKWLSEDLQGGFRSRLRYAPAGWQHSGAPTRSYFKKAQRFVYVLFGDLKVWTSEGPEDAGETIVLNKDYFVDQPPMSIWGWQDGPLSERGAMWLEVTYAEGARVGRGPIEQATVLP